MTSSAYVFAEDLVDEGFLNVLDRLREAGLGGATMAAAYHHSRDVFPHNPRRKLVYLEGGVTYFHTRVAGHITPHVATIARAMDPLAELAAAAREREMRASAWVVVLHNTRLAMAYPDCAARTAFGDPLLTSLCPANPDVRAYAVALAADVARYDLDAIKLEAVHYQGFDHGSHHERSFVPLSPNVRFVFGVCFCVHCLEAANAAGVDAERVQAVCRERIEAVFASATDETHETELDEAWLHSLAEGEMSRYLTMRQSIVTSLVHDMTIAVRAVAPTTRVIYLDPSGATLGYASGLPSTPRRAVSVAWRDGIDLSAVARIVDGVGMLGYFAEPSRFAAELEAYLKVVPAEQLEVILRPMWPDTLSADQLAERVALAKRAGVRDMSFYHYGFMRLENLAWIRQGLMP